MENEMQIRNLVVRKKIEEKNYDKSIYHYTSINSLYSILKNKELWFGNTANMNDKSEVTCFVKKLEKALCEDLKEEEKKGNCKRYFEGVYNRLKNEYPFVICFSELKDNAAQWERYADNAKGVCIEFNTEELMKLLYHPYLMFNEVFYEWDIRKHVVFKTLFEFFDTKALEEFENEKSNIENAVLVCGYMHKHNSFSSEKELRVATLWNKEIDHTEIEFENFNEQIKKVFKLDITSLCEDQKIDFENLINRILIGPRSSQNEHELAEFLLSLNYKNLAGKIAKSDCPLR